MGVDDGDAPIVEEVGDRDRLEAEHGAGAAFELPVGLRRQRARVLQVGPHPGPAARAVLGTTVVTLPDGEVYDLIVTNPPYVTHAETDALPKEYSHEPEMGLRAGDDGLDLALEILRDAPRHLSADGLLVCEVGESERALVALLPEVPFAWVEFKVGQMGIFVVERADLVAHHERIRSLADAREKSRATGR